MRKNRSVYAVTALLIASLIMLAFTLNASARRNYGATFGDHVGQNDCLDAYYTTLTDEATSAITTRCAAVESCVATIDTETTGTGAVAADIPICNVPTQSGANLGKVILSVRTPTGATAASGSTKVNYQVYGYGSK